jgi:itaconyl-CoA hydratase
VLDAAGRGLSLWALIETPRALHRLDAVLATPMLRGVVFGAADYAAATGCRTSSRALWWARSALVAGATAAGIPAVDSPFFELDNPAGLRAESQGARELGFAGKGAVHPDQLPVIREAFCPTADEITSARAIVAAAESSGGDLTRAGGQMVGPPLVAAARDLLARAERGVLMPPVHLEESPMSSTPQGYRPVGENRVREIVGRGLADFTVGEVIEHRPARTVSDMDRSMVLALTGNPAPVHSDTEYCARTGREELLVCGVTTLGIVIGATVRSTSGLTSANLALDEVKFTSPVHVGDTLGAETEVLKARRSASRPDQGVVTCRTTAFNQHGEQVITFTRTFLVPADATSVRDAADY